MCRRVTRHTTCMYLGWHAKVAGTVTSNVTVFSGHRDGVKRRYLLKRVQNWTAIRCQPGVSYA
jgi:hypothetical protein